MSLPTDKELAEEAKKRANDKSDSRFKLVEILCPACNEPVAYCEPDPNEYVPAETEDGYTNDRAAFEFSPEKIQNSNHENPWSKVHVVPETAGVAGETELRVIAYKHDHSTEAYKAWKKELDEMKDTAKRAEENKGLDQFA